MSIHPIFLFAYCKLHLILTHQCKMPKQSRIFQLACRWVLNGYLNFLPIAGPFPAKRKAPTEPRQLHGFDDGHLRRGRCGSSAPEESTEAFDWLARYAEWL
jgi:hypothetical protein